MKRKVTVVFTCFNRKRKTLMALNSLVTKNPNIDFRFIIVDDCSTDGTVEAIQKTSYKCKIIQGTGSLFWCGGMREGLKVFLESQPDPDELCLLINDDVEFFESCVEKMIDRLNGRSDYVVVGATCNKSGSFTYGLKTRKKWYQKNMTQPILPSKNEQIGETCNANCVLIPNRIVLDIGNMDSSYTHSLGDYDYGFTMTRKGYKLISSETYVGICEDNPVKGTWNDRSLSIKERLRKKETPKGSPLVEFWHFVRKNYGLWDAVWYTTISYLKIVVGR